MDEKSDDHYGSIKERLKSIFHDKRRLAHSTVEIYVDFYRYYGNASYGETLAEEDSPLRTADVIAICYNISKPETLHNAIYKWYPMALYFASDAPIFLIGCKTKRKRPNMVPESDAEAACRQIGAIRLLICSSTDGSFLKAVEREM
ncbi:14665_t:CDS:2, partial [Acaulospora colombiana]